jgi:hypothetical protein
MKLTGVGFKSMTLGWLGKFPTTALLKIGGSLRQLSFSLVIKYKNHKDIFVFAVFSPDEIGGRGTQTLDFSVMRQVFYRCATASGYFCHLLKVRGGGSGQNQDGHLGDGQDEATGSNVVNGVKPEGQPGADVIKQSSS